MNAEDDEAAPGVDAEPLDANVSDRITVMFASDSRGWLETLLRRLASEQDMDVVGDPFAELVQFLMALEQRRPRILLVDKGLIDRMGPDALRLIHALSPGTRVLLHWHEVCHDLALEIARDRFHGLLLTDGQPDACAKAIRAVHRGELWLPRALLASAIFGTVRAPACAGAMKDGDRPHASTGSALTRRQTQIVEQLRQGFTNKEIARKLGIMEDTVKKHLQGVFGRLGVHRRALVVLSEAASRPRQAQEAAELNALRRTPDSRDHLPL